MASQTIFFEAIEARRSYYALSHESPIPDNRIEEIVKHAVLHVPSPFNSQSARCVVLLREAHHKLWDIAAEAAKAMAPPEMFKNLYAPRIAGFREGTGRYGALMLSSFPGFPLSKNAHLAGAM